MSAPKITNPTLNAQQQQRLLQQRSRLEVIKLHGLAPSGKPWNEHLTDEIDALLTDETPATEKAKFAREAMHDPAKRSQLNALRIETTQNYVLATADFASFFEVEVLGEADQPAIQNETMHNVKVTYVAEDGTITTSKLVKPQAETLVDLHILTTEKVRYTLRDLYRGRVSDIAQRTFDLAYDVTMKMDAILRAHLETLIGSFDITNANKAARVYVPHPSVRADVLPTTNALQIASLSGSTKFGFAVMDKVIDYCNRFARAFRDGELIPTGEIIVPADEIVGIAASVTPVTAAQTQIAEDIARNGYFSVTYLGKTWRFLPNNVIPAGYCWPKFNKPIGKLYLKPSMDVAGVTTNEHENWEERWQSMVFGAATPSPRKVNVARVEYNTTGH